jgi:predicted MFS family arabinose efflux permease
MQKDRLRFGSAVLRLFLPFAFAYFLSYLFRSANAVVADDLARDLGADAAALGLVTGAYMVGFAAMQLPLGLWLDRYGPRRVLAALLLLASGGALGMAAAPETLSLALARGVVGAGVAGCLMASFKNNVLWWPKESLPLANSLILMAGTLGAFAATTPLAFLAGALGWRGAFAALALLTVVAAATIYFAVPEPAERPPAGESLRAQLAGMARVVSDGLFWRLAPVAITVQATHAAYISLWAGPWLRDVNGFDRDGVAMHLQAIPLAMILGYLATGFLSSRLPRLGFSPFLVVAVTIALFIANQALLLVPRINWPVAQWALFGFFATGSVLPFSILSQAYPATLVGRANTVLNLLIFASAFVVQVVIGVIVDAAGHRTALAAMTVLCGAAWLWLLLARATSSFTSPAAPRTPPESPRQDVPHR